MNAPEPRRAAAVELSRAHVRGEAAARLMVILRAPGCLYALRSGGCTNCGYLHLTTRGQAVSAEALQAQLDGALEGLDGATRAAVRQLDLYNSGSFFCDEEIPAGARPELLRRAAAGLPGLRAVMVESRPEFVETARLEQARGALPEGVTLELGIGLESADEAIRQGRIRKGFSLRAFERAAARVGRAGAELVVYVLLKPLGTGEEEAVQDVLDTGAYLVDLRRRLDISLRVALEPTFVPEETPLHEELRAGRYAPPSLWSVLRAVRGLRAMDLQVHVGLSDEGLPADHLPSGCPQCTEEIRAALAAFNESQNPAPLAALSCTCAGGSGAAADAGE